MLQGIQSRRRRPASKHIETRCRSENMAFLRCKKLDSNQEKRIDKGREVNRCVLGLISIRGVQKRWMLMLDACTTTQMNSKCVEKNKRNSKRHVLVDCSPQR